jgi:hypothetical protein
MRIASNGQGVMIRYMTSMLQVKSVLHSDGFEGMGSIVGVVVVYAEKDVQHEGPCRAKVESMSRSSLYQKEDE